MKDVPGCGRFAAFFFVGKPEYLIEARICIYRQYHGKVRSGGIICVFFCYDIYMIFIILLFFVI